MLELSDIRSSQEELQDYYTQLDAQHITPAWIGGGISIEPRSEAVPYLWHWRDMRMVPPLLWLISNAAKVTGRRFLGVHWDAALPPEQAAEKSGAPVAWTSIATMPITPSRS